MHAAARLADLVRTSAFRICTGFVGTPLIADALTDTGYAEVAYRLLLQTGCPSWLYSVTMGATTVWERWDSMLPDGSINPGEMTSFNHYALGAVADWLHRSVAGLAPADVAYRRLRIAPVPGGGLTSASARHLTPYGEATASWTIEAGILTVSATVPVGARAEVLLPGSSELVRGAATAPMRGRWTCRDAALVRPRTIRAVLDDRQSWDVLTHGGRRRHSSVRCGGSSTTSSSPRRLAPYLDAPVGVVPDVARPWGATTRVGRSGRADGPTARS